MPRKRRPSLAAELARLVVEYPERDWKNLVERLRNRELMDDLAATIEEAVNVASKTIGDSPKKRHFVRLGSVLSAVAEKDAKKAEFLNALKMRLSDKTQISLSEIRVLAASLGMKQELPSRRTQAVSHIIGHLAGKPIEEIEAALDVDVRKWRDENHGYDRWVDLILGVGAAHDEDRDSMPASESRWNAKEE